MIKSKAVIAAVKPEFVDIMWRDLKPLINMAIDHSNGELDIDGMKQMAIDGDILILTIYEDKNLVAVLTLERRDFQTGKSIVNITTAGGADIHLWMDDALAVIEELAKEQGCTEIYIVGRPGWQRMLKARNFKTIHTTVCRKIGE